MALLKHGVRLSNPWQYIADGDEVPGSGPITVSLARWIEARDRLVDRTSPVGVRVKNAETVTALAKDLQNIALIELEFPKFTDGRAFSQARQLREHLRYKGEIRAVGTILRDQYMFMTRCGFDSIELPDDVAAEGYLAALREFTVWYQPASDDRQPVYALRRVRKTGRPGAGLAVTANVAASTCVI